MLFSPPRKKEKHLHPFVVLNFHKHTAGEEEDEEICKECNDIIK